VKRRKGTGGRVPENPIGGGKCDLVGGGWVFLNGEDGKFRNEFSLLWGGGGWGGGVCGGGGGGGGGGVGGVVVWWGVGSFGVGRGGILGVGVCLTLPLSSRLAKW